MLYIIFNHLNNIIRIEPKQRLCHLGSMPDPVAPLSPLESALAAVAETDPAWAELLAKAYREGRMSLETIRSILSETTH